MCPCHQLGAESDACGPLRASGGRRRRSTIDGMSGWQLEEELVGDGLLAACGREPRLLLCVGGLCLSGAVAGREGGERCVQGWFLFVFCVCVFAPCVMAQDGSGQACASSSHQVVLDGSHSILLSSRRSLCA